MVSLDIVSIVLHEKNGIAYGASVFYSFESDNPTAGTSVELDNTNMPSVVATDTIRAVADPIAISAFNDYKTAPTYSDADLATTDTLYPSTHVAD